MNGDKVPLCVRPAMLTWFRRTGCESWSRPETPAASLASIGLGGLLVFLAVVGCGSHAPDKPAPTTYPVSGKVVAPAGTSVGGGAIQFQSTVDPSVTAIGEITSDGTFSLGYNFEGKRLPGTIAGPSRVTIIPPMGNDQTAVPFELPQPYTVEAKDNQFTITLPASRR